MDFFWRLNLRICYFSRYKIFSGLQSVYGAGFYAPARSTVDFRLKTEEIRKTTVA
jgi:hypothetical protein